MAGFGRLAMLDPASQTVWKANRDGCLQAIALHDQPQYRGKKAGLVRPFRCCRALTGRFGIFGAGHCVGAMLWTPCEIIHRDIKHLPVPAPIYEAGSVWCEPE